MPNLKNNSDQKNGYYYPNESVREMATVKEYDNLYDYSIQNREQFWAEQAEQLGWFKKWDRVLDTGDKPFYKWFVGEKLISCIMPSTGM